MDAHQLRAARRSLGLSARQMARKLDVSERAYRRWEAVGGKGAKPLPTARAEQVRALLSKRAE